jgi:hypothetical protein
MSCAPENRQKFLENSRALVQKRKPVEGVESLGLFYPRGSNYMYAGVTKYKDYATWEKYWAEIAKERGKGLSIITEQTDMFFEEIKL